MVQTPSSTVQVGEWTVIGREGSREVRPLTVTTGDRVRTCYETRSGEIWTACHRCDHGNPGTIAEHNNVLGGTCFACNGDGLARLLGTGEGGMMALLRLERTNWRSAHRRALDAEERQADHAAAATLWRADHPELAAGLTALAETTATGPLDPTINLRLYELAHRVRDGNPLDENETASAEQLLAEHRAERELRARQHHAGTVGDQLTITGEILVATPVSGGWGSSTLLVVAGAGDHDGVTAKTVTRTAAARELERGQTVTITGTVRGHEHYDGVPQTTLDNVAVTPAPNLAGAP